MLKALSLAMLIVLTAAGLATAQNIPPPSAWHPFRGGTNCIQVADAQGNFNCAAGTKVDPATGNMTVGGTLSFAGLTAATFSNGLALAAVGSGVQLLGSGDLVLSTSPATTVAPSGPLIRGVVFRVRQVGSGLCQLVVAGGNSFGQEFIIPVISPSSFQSATPGQWYYPYSSLLAFPGGPSGC